jgi:hypothetical protein
MGNLAGADGSAMDPNALLAGMAPGRSRVQQAKQRDRSKKKRKQARKDRRKGRRR